MKTRPISRIIGIVIVIGVVLAIGFLNFVTSKPLDYVMASRVDIPYGTNLCEIPEDSFAAMPVRFENSTARLMLNGLVQPNDLPLLMADCAVIVYDVHRYEPLLLGGIISSDNPAADRIARLALDDPDLIVIRIPTQSNVPGSIRAGDRVDLAVAIGSVSDPLDLQEGEMDEQFTAYPQTTYGDISPDALSAILELQGYVITPPEEMGGVPGQEEPVSEPTPAEPSLREPVTKTLVSGALVIYVDLEHKVSGISSSGETTISQGKINAIDVVIPRDVFEFVTMAINSGNLQIGLLSPLVDSSDDDPTIGASLQDFLDLYMQDREELMPAESSAEGE